MTDYTILEHAKHLMPPCTASQLASIETKLRYTFPSEYREFLLTADGGMLTDGVMLYSAGTGIHPAETLAAANSNRGDAPLVFIGRFDEEEFGFKISDEEDQHRPVYVYMHETGEIRKIADSFKSLIQRALVGESF
ncbi:MAG: SMI1/KNR4 family protein [Gammaproteobacteria bacterium]|nr:MAG: SMI1/KNR4 family protein [Gammaproteobacteria bacterium]